MRIFVLALIALVLTACSDSEESSSPAPSAISNFALDFSAIKSFDFTWTDASDATYYKLMENEDSNSGFTQVGSNISSGTQAYSHIVPLYARMNAQYILQSCNDAGCTDSDTLTFSDNLVDSGGYFKASNTDTNDAFGSSISLSSDGYTLAIGARYEESDSTGIDGDQDNNNTGNSGAVYIFSRSSDGNWSQQAYLKASNTEFGDRFGDSISLSTDGNTLAVGAPYEDSNATGADGLQNNNDAENSGAVYVFSRSDSNWSQQSYIKASNSESYDYFGQKVDLSEDGDMLAISALYENSNATNVNGDEGNNDAEDSGAAYLFKRNSSGNWSQQAYIKASNTETNDVFGHSLALSSDGTTLAVGAIEESSNATGIDGDQSDNSESESGAVYIYTIDSSDNWSHQAYIKASNTENHDEFGNSVALSSDGSTLAVGASNESSNATGVDGDQNDNSSFSGAAYVFTKNSSGVWSQQAYIKASNTEYLEGFAKELSLSSSGDTLAISAYHEESNATGINGDQFNSNLPYSGAVYVFSRTNNSWSQQAYVKSINPDEDDRFGDSLDISADGKTLAIGSEYEDSNADGIDGDQTNNDTISSGAVYLY